MMLRIVRYGKPVIAKIQGFALGGGMELAMACHLRIASDAAKIGQPEINLGVIPGFGGTQRLLRLAGRSATLELCLLGHHIGQPEINLGILPGFGGTQRLLRLAGRSAALELCLLGHHIGAQRGYELGALTRVVSIDQLDAEVQKIAEQLATSAPQAVRGVLDAVLIGGETHIDAGLDYESQAFAICAATADMKEGTTAFLERRKPVFRGQ